MQEATHSGYPSHKVFWLKLIGVSVRMECLFFSPATQRTHQITKTHSPSTKLIHQVLYFPIVCLHSGSYFPWRATAIGRNASSAKQFLEKRYNPEMELEDAIHTALLTLKEGFEGEMTQDTVEIGTPP